MLLLIIQTALRLAGKLDAETDFRFTVADHCFVLLYAVEMIIKIVGYGLFVV